VWLKPIASSPGRLHVKLTQVVAVYYLSEVATELEVHTLATPQNLTQQARAEGKVKFVATRLDPSSSA
jgi:hypothetical protein